MPSHPPRSARPTAAVLACALAGTALLSGCGSGISEKAAADPVRTSLEQLVAAIPDDAQVSVVSSGGDIITTGEVTESTAWSTIKVPIVIEALREGGDELDEQAREAITESDNDAASALFNTLGGGYQSSTKIDNLLREAGDETTLTLPNAALGGDTGFGMTQWSSADQARFASWLACSDDEAVGHVYTLMSDLVDTQAVGIETVEGGHAKSGWGTNENTGVSTMRQLGVIDTGSGFIAMSIVITGDDYQDVIGEITVLSDWLAGHEDELPTFRCGAPGD